MMNIPLADKKCIPCEAGTLPLTPQQTTRLLSQLKKGWEVENNFKIKREFEFKGFKAAMKFVNKIAELAQSEGHHPNICIFYNIVKLELWTHAIGGLSENDFILAAKIDQKINDP